MPATHWLWYCLSACLAACICCYSEPVQVLSAGSYNFCRFALLQEGQTSSSCSMPATAAAAAANSSAPPAANPVIEGFQLSSSSRPAGESATTTCSGRCHDDLQNYASTPPLQSGAHAAAAAAGDVAALQPQGHHDIRGLLAQQLSKQNDLLGSNTEQSVPGVAEDLSGLSHLDLSGGPDLIEEAEESLVTQAGAADSAAGPDSSNSTNDVAAGPCLLALPTSDAADVGIWELGGQPGCKAAGSTGGSTAGAGQVMLLKQQRSQCPSHGLCMAVALLQPQVRMQGGGTSSMPGAWGICMVCFGDGACLQPEAVLNMPVCMHISTHVCVRIRWAQNYRKQQLIVMLIDVNINDVHCLQWGLQFLWCMWHPLR